MGDEDSSNQEPLIKMENIHKWFGKVHAVNGVDFKVNSGEIVALVGDNGAGKSTLIKILSGVLSEDRGDIYWKGEKVDINSVDDARELNIETAFQEMAVIDNLSVSENIFLGREKMKGFPKRIDFEKMREESKKAMKALELNVPPDREVRFCSGGEKQGTIISRAMYYRSELVILDEPTRALSVAGVRKVHNYIQNLKDEDISCIYISHNIRLAYPLSDRFVVLSDGKKVYEAEKAETNIEEIEKIIVEA